MQNQNFTTAILVDQSPKEVFGAIINPRAWWSEEIEGRTASINDVFTYHYEDIHRCKVKLIEIIPDKKVVWKILDNYFSFTKDKTEWIDTEISFEISRQSNKTQLVFTHIGLVPEYECYQTCHQGWTHYIQKSLKSLIQTGKGLPNSTGTPRTASEKKFTSSNSYNMSNQNFSVTLLVDQTPEEVFTAVTNVRNWWSGYYAEEIEGNTENLNDEFSFRAGGGAHYSKQKLTEVIPGKKIVWLVTDSELSFIEKKDEWVGTKIIFDISKKGNKTQLVFTHEGLVPEIACYNSCSPAWSMYIQEKLLPLITASKDQTGKNAKETKSPVTQ